MPRNLWFRGVEMELFFLQLFAVAAVSVVTSSGSATICGCLEATMTLHSRYLLDGCSDDAKKTLQHTVVVAQI